METIKLKTHIGSDGILKIEMPTNFRDIATEIVIVLQPTPGEPTNALGWPLNYFDSIDAIKADDIIERADQGSFEIRESLE